ncbi:CBS domain-containing protein [Streptomyces sp. ID05-47C]|uniref:CBS domain-containing protein n=1 Tax=Streptomyces sp. ID05-47C TaxID=3028665 RepID=UPI0029C01F3F|nr:CBS domain-containing protein [Streptomyces sp. ID05-47C]
MKATRVDTVMVRDVVTAEHGTPFKEVVRRLDQHLISGLPVIDSDRKVIGVVSETDLLLRQAASSAPAGGRVSWAERLRELSRRVRRNAVRARAGTAGGVMSAPAVTVGTHTTVPEAARLMAERGIERLPVVDEKDRLVGIVTRRELLQMFLRPDDEIRRTVEQQVFVDTLWLAPHLVEASVRNGVVTLTGQLERRSDIPVAVGMSGRVDGVVAVVDRLSYRLDDSHLRSADHAALHGITDLPCPRSSALPRWGRRALIGALRPVAPAGRRAQSGISGAAMADRRRARAPGRTRSA